MTWKLMLCRTMLRAGFGIVPVSRSEKGQKDIPVSSGFYSLLGGPRELGK